MNPPRYPCDLHCHTTRSDGNDTPRELIDNAAAIGMAAIGVVDHDIIPPETVELGDGRSMPLADYAAAKGLKVLPGYEFSCDTDVDDVHICGYHMDWTNPGIAAEMAACERSKAAAYEELCHRLGGVGMPVDWEKDILEYTDAHGERRCRVPEEVQRKHIFEAIAAKGYTPNWSDAKILVRDNPALNVSRRKINPLDAISLIHECGGIAILAHPYLIDERVGGGVSRWDYIENLIKAGLDGIEAAYSYDKTSYKGRLSPEEIEKEVRAAYGGRLRLISGGSDYHADHKKKPGPNCRMIGERGIGLLEFESIYNAKIKNKENE